MTIVKTLLIFILLPLAMTGQVIKFKKNWQPDPSDNTYAKKRFFLQVDYGLNNVLKQTWTRVDDYGAYADDGIGPLSAKLEYAVAEKWSALVGASYFNGNASWRVSELDTNKEVILYDKGFDYKSYTLFIGANTHIFTSPTVDIYLGGHFGYTQTEYKPYISLIDRKDYEVPKKLDPWYYNGYFGIRINYSRRSGFYLEAGQSNMSNICVGTVYRFGL
jgi:hypothetical protein